MKNKRMASKVLLSFSVVALCFIAAERLCFAHSEQFILKPESQLWLEGQSTLHPYKSSATIVNVTLNMTPETAASITPKILLDGVAKGDVKVLDLSIPVESLKSGEKGLDKNMYKALKSDKNPNIAFHLTNYSVTLSTVSESTLSVQAEGKLSIAGAEKTVKMNPSVGVHGMDVVIDGKQDIIMSEYGVKPPSLMFGAIKVADLVVVKFHIVMERTAEDLNVKKNK